MSDFGIGYNPALDAPFRDIPHTLVVSIPGYVYYFEFPGEPGPDEFYAAKEAVLARMAKALGIRPSTPSYYGPSRAIRWDEITATLQSEPILVK